MILLRHGCLKTLFISGVRAFVEYSYTSVMFTVETKDYKLLIVIKDITLSKHL